MTIKTFSNNDMGQNIYLYYDEKSVKENSDKESDKKSDKESGVPGIIIDAGCSEADKKAIASYIEETNITVQGILLTHGHYDHIIALATDGLKNLAQIQAPNQALIYCHEEEKQVMENPNINLSAFTGDNIKISPDHLFKDSDIFQFGNVKLKVLHIPGHTPGGCCYYDEENSILFPGDTLFKESIGRTDFPLGDHQILIDSISKKLLVLPNDTKVYPGHGPATTIGHEKDRNPFLK